MTGTSEIDCLGDLNERKGNHKSAMRHEHFLGAEMEKEVMKGWEILINDKEAANIISLELSLIGIAECLRAIENGECVEKLRVAHNLSCAGNFLQESINSRVEKEN